MGKGRAPCCDKSKVKKGPWSPAEDLRLTNFIQIHGHSNWRALPKQAGLLRCGKSCRLRWINYLRPDVKRGNFTPQEEQTIINLHNTIGNKWSKIASYLPGRTDNEIKNVWNTHLKKRVLTTKDGKDKELELYSSSSPSCTSSTSTTSLPDHQPGQDQSDPKKPNEKPQSQNNKKQYSNPTDYNESKLETISSSSTSDSPTSSYGSNLSNEKNPNETVPEFSRFNPDEAPNNGKFEIPLESDCDFWELFDSLDPDYSGQTDPNAGENTETEVECSQWLKLLENELGLTSDVDILPEDQNMEITNNLEPEISQQGLDYFPIWPCSPQNLGI